ncbi:MAG: cyclophilin-like fold protein [Candidatus Thorarchaeota archaeon]|nr:cyclophilin-like fold protein [Candidatus Thorarchaeota archaeon]
MSESDIPIEIRFENDFTIHAVLDRVKAPLIIEEIKFRLPIDTRTAYMRGEMKFLMEISKGNLKPTKSVKRGEIAYMPLGDSLCIYLQDMDTFSPVNIIGNVTSEDELLERIKDVRRGSQATIQLKN